MGYIGYNYASQSPPIPGVIGQLDQSKRTINEITGFEVHDITAKVDPNTGKIIESKVGVKIVFGIEHSYRA